MCKFCIFDCVCGTNRSFNIRFTGNPIDASEDISKTMASPSSWTKMLWQGYILSGMQRVRVSGRMGRVVQVWTNRETVIVNSKPFPHHIPPHTFSHLSPSMVRFSSPTLVSGTAWVPPSPREVASRSLPCMWRMKACGGRSVCLRKGRGLHVVHEGVRQVGGWRENA